MECNDWADWGQSDWGNGWTTNNAISQNYNRQPTPKDQESTNQSTVQNKVNQSASGYFENNSLQEDDWFVQNQSQNIQAQRTTFESINNNNSINQIENREDAPPDNKQSYESTQNRQNHYDFQQSWPNQFYAPPKGFPSQQANFNNAKTSNISNYFEANHPSSGRTRPLNVHPSDNFMSHSSVSSQHGTNQPHQEQFRNEPLVSSGGPPGAPAMQRSTMMSQGQQNNKPLQQLANINVSDVSQQQHSKFIPLSSQQFSDVSQQQHSKSIPLSSQQFSDVSQQQHSKSNPFSSQQFSDLSQQQHSKSIPLSSQQFSDVSQQQHSKSNPLSSQQFSDLSQQQHSKSIPLSSQQFSDVSQQQHSKSIPLSSQQFSDVSQQQHSKSNPLSSQQFSDLSQQQHSKSIPLSSQQFSDVSQQQHSKSIPLSSQQYPGMQQHLSAFAAGPPPSIQQQSSNLVSGQKPNLPLQNPANALGQQFPNSSRMFHPQEVPSSVHQNFPSNVPSGQQYPGAPMQPTNLSFDMQSAVVSQQTSNSSEVDQPGIHQQPSSDLSLEQQSHGINQPMSLERPPSAGQQPSNSESGQHQNQSSNIYKQMPQSSEENHVDIRRYTPSPQQQIFQTSNHPPPPQANIQTAMGLESHDNKTPINIKTSNSVHPAAFHSTNLNIFPPIATSSPVTNNNQALDNQDEIPDNKEYPDNAENIAQDLKALKISPPREIEQEAQKHCAIDRNQYLETGQFSAQKENTTYLQNVEMNDESEAPPPGLHRLVTGQGYEPWQIEREASPHPGQTGESTPATGATRQSSPLSSIGGESEGREGDKERRREVPGEAEPLQGRVVLGQVPTPPQDTGSNRGGTNRGERERERLERMVVGEHGLSGNISDDYRQSSRPSRHSRPIRNDSSYEEEERDYSSDRDRRNDDRRHRDDRPPRRRREQRSPEYRSDEEFEDRRGYHNRSGRDSRRRRDYSPDRSYYRDYYREEDPRHHRAYYPREYDDYNYRENQRSRPSSRSGSDYRGPLKHSMRVLPGHHYYHDPYVAAPSYHDYNLKYSQRTIEYFERMRHVDPAGYAAWYSQYMQGRMMQESSREFSSGRASVHSGQSSSNQRQGVSTPQEAVDDLTREEDEVDYTPRLYDCAHIRGSMDSYGRLILVEPNYPLDQQKATVHLCRLPQVSLDRDSDDFFQSPGPFIPGITHRNTVLQYLKKASDRSSKSSEKLLYDLVHLTVKGNGEVNGSDVAELLMESYKKSMQDEREASEERATPVSSKEVTSRFRELLQQGNKAEALDWAMENGAWGHALFLASKMGERTHNDIMLRFANSIPHNDPLQTLYQLMSGYIPQSASCCADKKWSDWRPHLAMILSNPTGNVDLDRQAIITLGDSLNASGRLFASHFCYITANVEFSQFCPDAKYVLLGSSHNQEFSKFATCRAIMLTMCYEYGLKLKKSTFSIATLQIYKLILAARLIDNGRIRNALQYCELLAQETLAENNSIEKSLISSVIEISSRLKMLDPVLSLSGNTYQDPDWLANLKQLYDSLPDERQRTNSSHSPTVIPENSAEYSHQDMPYQVSEIQPNSYIDTGSGPISIGVPTYSLLNQTSNPVSTYQPLNPSVPAASFPPLIPQNSRHPPMSQNEAHLHQEDMYRPSGFIAPSSLPPQQNSLGYVPAQVSDGPQSMPGPIDISSGNDWDSRPQPVMHSSAETSTPSRNNFFKATEEQLKAVDESKPTMKVLNEVGGEKKTDGKPAESKAPKKGEEQSSGWLGGFWDKIALRPKNQMRLPDDSNPSIIWDEKKKRWVNLDGETESSANAKPPPKASEALPPQGNKYKIQKGKMMKSNYVDVMGNKEKGDNGASNFMPSMIPPPVKTNFFIPPPVKGNDNAPVDFITPAPNNPVIADTADHNKQQLSRSSSVSSLSREVQFYMAPPKGYHQQSRVQGNVPTMYNTSRFPS